MYRVIETHLIETFVEVVRRGSVTEAARALGRSQPAVSHRLRQLEEAFGTPLFEKVGRRLQLTEAGERLVDEAVELVDRLRALPNRVSESGAVRGTVTVGSVGTLGRHLMVEGMHRVLDEHAGVKLVVRFAAVPELRDALLGGRIDMVAFVGELNVVGLDVSRVADVAIRVGLSPVNAPEHTPTLDDLRSMRFLGWRGAGEAPLSAIDEWALAEGLVDDTTPEIPHVETLRALATTGVGWVALPDYAMRDDERAGRLVTFPAPGFERKFPVRLAVRSGWKGGTAADRVRQMLVEHLDV